MSKKLLEEGAVRSFMKLANLEPLAEEFVKEKYEELEEDKEKMDEAEDETLAEDNYDKSGPGPHREGAGKDGEHHGISQNQGKEPPSSPDGKLEIPGTSYAGDHKMKDTSVTKKSIEGGKPLAENLDDMDDMPGDDMPGDDMGGEMDDMPSPEPEGDDMMGGDNEALLKKVVNAVADALGVDVAIDGDDGEMDLDEPADDDMAPEPEMGGEEPDMMENNLSGLKTEDLMAELEKRGAVTLEEEEVEEMTRPEDKDKMMEAVEEISKRVARNLLKRKK